uniref:Uncharacterized protein n=1 Tax=Oryza nivara TaxID=4536 RepID=A0A0E0H126_ORYNI
MAPRPATACHPPSATPPCVLLALRRERGGDGRRDSRAPLAARRAPSMPPLRCRRQGGVGMPLGIGDERGGGGDEKTREKRRERWWRRRRDGRRGREEEARRSGGRKEKEKRRKKRRKKRGMKIKSVHVKKESH